MFLSRRILSLLWRRDNTIVPAICFTPCNDAFIEAQKIGLNPSLCTLDSVFTLGIQECNQCVVANGGSTNDTSLASYVSPQFASFINYCTSLLSSYESTTTKDSSQIALQSLYIEQGGVISSFEARLSSLEAAKNHTTTIYQTQTSFQVSATLVVSDPSATHVGASRSKSRVWIAGPVIGGLVVILAIVGIALWIRRRKIRQAAVDRKATEQNSPAEKAQLHGDSLDPVKHKAQLHGESHVVHELEANTGNDITKVELPAPDPIGSELDVGWGTDRGTDRSPTKDKK
ncbi:hypothetical protein B0O99DRAFT_598577 [Bisporella sp. PMI_857]|nr:hypothetical protein B0O99DRAFT_598577 [Bisporella sp. PMI_857]